MGNFKKPRVFIGSSVEGRKIADAIQVNLEYDAYCAKWDQLFPLSTNTIDELLKYSRTNDFAILIFSADDDLIKREQAMKAVRDNVIFEAGICLGVLGKDRVFIVSPSDRPNLNIPTDLYGLMIARYEADSAQKGARPALGVAAARIREAIEESTWSKDKLSVTPNVSAEGSNYPLKLIFEVKNTKRYAVGLESLSVDLKPPVYLHSEPPTRSNSNASGYMPMFSVGTKDVVFHVLNPGETVKAWVPIANSTTEAELRKAINEQSVGTWHYACHWLEKQIKCEYKETF